MHLQEKKRLYLVIDNLLEPSNYILDP